MDPSVRRVIVTACSEARGILLFASGSHGDRETPFDAGLQVYHRPGGHETRPRACRLPGNPSHQRNSRCALTRERGRGVRDTYGRDPWPVSGRS
jgi:hypothetical protein